MITECKEGQNKGHNNPGDRDSEEGACLNDFSDSLYEVNQKIIKHTACSIEAGGATLDQTAWVQISGMLANV